MQNDNDLFTDGYFSRLILAGYRPDYRLPPFSLPEVPEDAVMEITHNFT